MQNWLRFFGGFGLYWVVALFIAWANYVSKLGQGWASQVRAWKAFEAFVSVQAASVFASALLLDVLSRWARVCGSGSTAMARCRHWWWRPTRFRCFSRWWCWCGLWVTTYGRTMVTLLWTLPTITTSPRLSTSVWTYKNMFPGHTSDQHDPAPGPVGGSCFLMFKRLFPSAHLVVLWCQSANDITVSGCRLCTQIWPSSEDTCTARLVLEAWRFRNECTQTKDCARTMINRWSLLIYCDGLHPTSL